MVGCRVMARIGVGNWLFAALGKGWQERHRLTGFHRFVGYISNHIFPKPLTEAEEKDCLQKFAAGDEEARNILIEHNLRLVAHICKKFESTGLDKDDLISIGTIGLIKGINTFQADKGTRLATYAARCIEKPILRSWKQIEPIRNKWR
jgi:RNA polymerase sporulation-specific sigma factor